ncbi:9637_t:CDS:1, partial [Funneliformis geosporum]
FLMERTGAPLTDNEKSMVISVYKYFSGVSFKTEDHQKATLRKRVSDALRISESTVGVVVADWNKRGDNTFTPHKTLGRPKSQPDENISELL